MSTEEANGIFLAFRCACTWMGELDDQPPFYCPTHGQPRAEAPTATWFARGTQLGLKEREYL